MKEFIISSVFGLIAAVVNVFTFGSEHFIWGLSDPDGFGGVLGILFVSPLLLGMIIFRIMSKCKTWFYSDILIWIYCGYLSVHETRIHLQIVQAILIVIPIIQIIIARSNQNEII
jgi:hypothetical protein